MLKKGFNFYCHDKKLPGTPDIVLKDKKIIINIKGCFWHFHKCFKSKIPKKNQTFWKNKFEKNKINDLSNKEYLTKKGWRVFDIWECALIEENIFNTKNYLLKFISH